MRPPRFGAGGALTTYAIALGVGCASFRITSTPGAESAFVLGLLLPPAVAAFCARRPAAAHRGEASAEPLALVARALGWGAWATLLPTGILLARGALGRLCQPALGLSFMVLGPVAGVGIASLVGLCVGSLLGPDRSRTSAWIAASVPAAFVLAGLLEFVLTPSIDILSPFAGYFPGTFYDEDLGVPLSYVTYRGLHVFLAVGLVALFVGGHHPGLGRLSLARLSRRHGALAALSLGMGAYALGLSHATELGHLSTRGSIAEALGARYQSRRCVIHLPRETPPERRGLWGQECDYHVTRIEERLAIEHPERLAIFVYRSPAEKRALMGAGRTQIAKPFRDEVHVQASAWPHPVLGHELVHVLAAAFAPPPFRVASRHAGLIPNPGLIEGLAVAIAWDLREGLDPDQWSRAMLELGELPAPERLVGMGFAGLPPREAYAAAGSFIAHVLRVKGVDAVKAIYREGRVEGVVEASLETLAEGWHSHLRRVQVPTGTLERARLRFASPSIFDAVCPHEVAALRSELAADRAAGDHRAALSTSEAIVELASHDEGAQMARVEALAMTGAIEEASAAIGTMEARDAPVPVIARSRSLLGDGLSLRGRFEEARAQYERALGPALDGDLERALVVRLLALEAREEVRALLLDLLLGRDGRPTSPAIAVHLAREIAERRSDGLGSYLEARQLYFQARHDRALSLLREAATRGLPHPSLRRERARLEALSLAAERRFADARSAFEALAEDPAMRSVARVWLPRLDYLEAEARAVPSSPPMGRPGAGPGREPAPLPTAPSSSRSPVDGGAPAGAPPSSP